MGKITKIVVVAVLVFLMSSVGYAEEIYVEGNGFSGFIRVDEGYAEGFLEDGKGDEIFVEGDFQNGTVYDGLNFYDGIPEAGEDFFDQEAKPLPDDFFGQEEDWEFYEEGE